MTDTDDFTAKYQRYLEVLSQANALNKTAVFDALLAAGIKTVTVTFNGESDSGQIEEVVAYAKEGPAPQIPATSIQFRFMSWGITDPAPRDLALPEAIEDLCYGYLSQEHDGWENNDGAYGDFTLHVEDRRIELAFNARFSDSVHHGHTF